MPEDVTPLPREAREGVMRAFIAILEKRYPGTKWVPASPFECDHCGDGDALRDGEACAYCGHEKAPGTH